MQEYNLEEICARVKNEIRESLGLSDEDFSLSANLMNDLEAESLDFLDIIFRLEKSFGVKIERNRIEKTLRSRFPKINIKPNTMASEEIKLALQEMLPEVPNEEINAITKVKNMTSTFRAATFVRMSVQAILERGEINIVATKGHDGYMPEQLGVAIS